MMNKNLSGLSYGQGIDVGGGNTTTMGKNIIVENNTVTECWGNAIDLLYCDFCVARNNTIRNGFSTMMKADNSRNLLIERNFIYVTNKDFNSDNGKYPGLCFGYGMEDHGTVNSTNITFRNNLCLNTIHAVAQVGSNGYYADLKIVHNTFFNVSSLGLQINGNKYPELNKNNEVSNNLFSGGENFKVDIEKKSWTVFNNGWLFGNKSQRVLPDTLWNESFYIKKKSMEEVLFPKAKEREPCFDIECFLPRCLSDIGENDKYGNLLIGKGRNSKFSDGFDFFGRPRDKKTHTIGFSELCVLPDDWIIKNSRSYAGTIVITILVILLILAGVFLFIKYRRKLKDLTFMLKQKLIDIKV